MALKYHPDRNPNIENPEEAFSKINQAYKVLSEYVQSAEFDDSGREAFHDQWADEPTQPGAKKSTKRDTPPADKQHYKYSLLLTLEECAAGCSKVIHFYRTSPLGKKEEVRLEVTIPAGVKEGQKLKLKNEGPVLADGSKGHLFIYVDVLPHPLFERRGRNVYMDLPINVTTAILGGKVVIPTLLGKANLNITPNTHTGRIFRLKQKGFSHLNESNRGDMLVKVIVDFPENLSQDELIALEVLSKKTPPLVKDYTDKLHDCLINRKR